MDQAPPVTPLPVLVLFWLGSWAALAVWAAVYQRRRAGLPSVPVQARRQVPWRGGDVAMVLLFYVVATMVLFALAHLVLGDQACRPLPIGQAENSTEHVAVRLFVHGSAWTMFACFVAAAMVAPVAEEILFRLILQGWLESLDRRLRPRMPTLRRWFRWGTLPVVLSSLLFAVSHFRIETEQYGLDFLRFMMIGGATVTLATAVVAIALARWLRGATAADLGFVREKVLADVGLGLAAFGGVVAPLYACQLALTKLLPSYLAPDPFALFPFALVLGFLYCRTHRIVPSMVLHAALNTTSLAMLWMMMRG